MNSLKN